MFTLSKFIADSVTFRAESMFAKDGRGDVKAQKLMDYAESRQRKTEG